MCPSVIKIVEAATYVAGLSSELELAGYGEGGFAPPGRLSSIKWALPE